MVCLGLSFWLVLVQTVFVVSLGLDFVYFFGCCGFLCEDWVCALVLP